jgi:hypothetical protein
MNNMKNTFPQHLNINIPKWKIHIKLIPSRQFKLPPVRRRNCPPLTEAN